MHFKAFNKAPVTALLSEASRSIYLRFFFIILEEFECILIDKNLKDGKNIPVLNVQMQNFDLIVMFSFKTASLLGVPFTLGSLCGHGGQACSH